MYQKVERSYSEVFYYCIQEAVYWKLKAEIYNNSEQDKIRIEDPTKSSNCKIHSENDVTKYVYIPTDMKNIDENQIDLELTKVGLGARNGVDNVMLVVKELEECRTKDTFNMISKLGFHGGEFKESGMVMVTEDRKLINDRERTNFSEPEEQYFRKEAKQGYSSVLRTVAEKNRVFSFDKRRIDENPNQERKDRRSISNFRKIRNSAEIVRHTTKGVKYKSRLTDTGLTMYNRIDILSRERDFQFDKKINQDVINVFSEGLYLMKELRIDERKYVNEQLKAEEVLGTLFILGGIGVGAVYGAGVGGTIGSVAGPPGVILVGAIGGVIGGVGGGIVRAVNAIKLGLFKK